MNYLIRDITLEDVDSFWQALDSICKERVYLNNLEAYPKEQIKQHISKNIDLGYPNVVAEANGKVVGFGEFVSDEREAFKHAANLGMGVIKEYRGQGVGEALLDTLIKQAINKSYKRLDLEVFASNTVAINLYKKKGFQQEGIKRKVRYIDGEYMDSIIMARLF